MGLGLEICSDGIFSLGLGADDDDKEDDGGLGVSEEAGLLVWTLEMELRPEMEVRPELRLGLEPL